MAPVQGVMKILASTLSLLLAFAATSQAAQYEAIWSQPQSEQERLFSEVLNKTGHDCPAVTEILFAGVDEDDAGYWSVRCSDGRDWIVQVLDDDNGTISVTSCEVIRQHQGDCWATE